MNELQIKSPAFEDNGYLPKKHTGFAADISPAFALSNLDPATISLAITMDDLDIPFTKAYNHWLIWNIPAAETIPENIPYGSPVELLKPARQGRGYGRNRYRGPKQPWFVRRCHHYHFHFYALDCFVTLNDRTRKHDLLAAMHGHILQEGGITGKYQR